MTVGERIQYYRKQSGISQEELGQRLLVSRQTVSQWENDQTVPTIDNLLRLKEIFGVSVDELLGEMKDEQNNSAETEAEPFEQYNYSLSRENTVAMKKYFFGKISRNLFLSVTVIALVCLAYVLLNPPVDRPFIWYSVFAVFMTALLLAVYFVTKSIIDKNWKSQEKSMLESVHEYKLYNGYMTVSVYQNSELHGMVRVYYDRIDKIHDLGEFRLIETEKQYYPISVTDFNNSSFFNQFININPKKAVNEERDSKWKTLSRFFIILSVFAVILVIPFGIAIISINLFPEDYEAVSIRIPYVLVLLPISSVVFGIVALCKRVKAKKNIIIGSICILLGCFLCAVFGVANNQLDKGLIVEFENETGYDLPEAVSVYGTNKMNEDEDVYDFPEGSAQEGWYCSFETDSVSGRHFVKTILNDSNWLTEAPEDYDKIFCLDTTFTKGGYFLAYNTITGEYNKLPSKSGEYRFFNISYDIDNQFFILEEYYVNYTQNNNA